jgi:hypothetical protein
MSVKFHPHARERMNERGASEADVKVTIEMGEKFQVKYNRTGFRRNLTFNCEWRGKYYNTKQVEVYAVKEDADWVVITVITKYF